MAEIGDRVGAILSTEQGVVNFFGYGVYDGKHIPEGAVGPFAQAAVEVGLSNPRIKLDSGEFVYGCECWWGPEKKVKELINNHENVVMVDVVEWRKKHSPKEENVDNN